MSFNRFTQGTPMQPRQGKFALPPVTIYFIGTELLTKLPNGEEVAPPIYADGHGLIPMPKIGDPLTVPQNVAQSLIWRTRVPYRKGHKLEGQFAEGFTTDPFMAEQIAKAYYAKKDVAEVVAESLIEKLSDELVDEIIARREAKKAKAAKKEDAPVEETPPPPPPPTEAKPDTKIEDKKGGKS